MRRQTSDFPCENYRARATIILFLRPDRHWSSVSFFFFFFSSSPDPRACACARARSRVRECAVCGVCVSVIVLVCICFSLIMAITHGLRLWQEERWQRRATATSSQQRRGSGPPVGTVSSYLLSRPVRRRLARSFRRLSVSRSRRSAVSNVPRDARSMWPNNNRRRRDRLTPVSRKRRPRSGRFVFFSRKGEGEALCAIRITCRPRKRRGRPISSPLRGPSGRLTTRSSPPRPSTRCRSVRRAPVRSWDRGSAAATATATATTGGWPYCHHVSAVQESRTAEAMGGIGHQQRIGSAQEHQDCLVPYRLRFPSIGRVWRQERSEQSTVLLCRHKRRQRWWADCFASGRTGQVDTLGVLLDWVGTCFPLA